MNYDDRRSPSKRSKGRGAYGTDEEDHGDDKQKESRLQREKPARTLFVRNIAYETPEEVIRELFGKYGEIKKIFNLIPTRGMVFLSYYDLRHADTAKRELQDYELSGRKIDVHYSLPKEDSSEDEDKNKGTLFVTVRDPTEPVENEALKKLFEQWGEIKEVRDCTGYPSQKFIECWDLRDSGKIVTEKQGTPFAGGTLDIKFAYHSTPRSRTDRHSGPNVGSVTGGPSRKHSVRHQVYGGSSGAGGNVVPLGNQGLLAQPNAISLLAQAGLSNNLLGQVQLLSHLSALTGGVGVGGVGGVGIGGTGVASPAAVQQLAYLLQLQQLQRPGLAVAPGGAGTGGTPGVNLGGTGGTGTGAGGGYQGVLPNSSGGNYGVY